MTAKRPTPRRCPRCGAFVAADAEACKRCGTVLFQRPPILATVTETLLVVSILAALVGGVWLMRPPPPQPLEIPRPRPTPTPIPTSTWTPTWTPTPTSTPTPTITPTPTPSFFVHTVEAGDTLIGIALAYGVPLEAILEANDIDRDSILHIGQELIVPLGAEFEPPTPTATPLPGLGFNIVTYTVQAGDTLLGIAQQFKTTVADIVEANGLPDPEVILQIGQVLVIPVEAPTPAPVTPSPTPTATATRTPRPSPTPAEPSPTPRFSWPAPVLLSPPDGTTLEGTDTVLLNWVSVGILPDDAWYVVRVATARPGEPERSHTAWVKATAWRLPADLAPAEGTSQRYRWSVTVMRRDEATGEEMALSPQSEGRSFVWRQ